MCACVSLLECEAHGSVDVHDHLSSGLVAFAVVGSFLLLLQHAVAGRPVLQRKLAENFAEPVDADVSHAVGRMTEEQQEGVEPENSEGTGSVGKCFKDCPNCQIFKAHLLIILR